MMDDKWQKGGVMSTLESIDSCMFLQHLITARKHKCLNPLSPFECDIIDICRIFRK